LEKTERRDKKMPSPGIIKGIFVGIIMIVVLGWVASEVLTTVPENSDNLGVISTTNDYGPTVVKILFIGFFILGVAALLRYLNVV